MCTARRRRVPAELLAFAALAFALLTTSPASAQYFGQNKVQYKDFKFRILKTEHFDIYYYPEEQQGIEIAARMAERWQARLERVLEHRLRGRQPLLMYASHTDFEQTNAIPGELGEGTGGVTEPIRRRIVLPFGGPLGDTDHVIGHELVHAFQYDITTNPNSPPGQNGAERLPLWFIEGMAEYLSLGPVDPNTAMWLRDAARQDKLPKIEELDNPKYFPYRWGQAFWAYVGGRFGDGVIRQMLAIASASGDASVAIERVLNVKVKDLSEQWHQSIRSTYEPVFAVASTPGDAGRLVIKGTDLTDLNVGPSISPDGKWLAFLSSRGFFSIDLYIADASSGRIVRKLTSTATDPHYSSIQFIYSAGAWDASSQRIAIATVANGRPAIAIFNAMTGNKERDLAIPDVDEVTNPTWAPDGHALAFTGFRQGLTDLYVYDVNTSRLHQLTDDAFADLQPAWSPDGSRIAFATDRFSSNLATLAIGDYRLALIDPESGRIEQVRAFTSGKNLNPQWSPDGNALYFLSDRDGISNLYRVTLASGAMAELTHVGTGLSGITNASPALSVASKEGTAAFSVYEESKYDIYTLAVGNRGEEPREVAFNAAVLPPPDRQPSQVAQLLGDATFGLPAATAATTTADYKPKMSLEGVAQPSLGVGASQFGPAVAGGAALYFSDMLGDHNLVTAFQFNSIANNFSVKDLTAEVVYLNQARRWNWGVVAGQVPYLSGGFGATLVPLPNGDIAEVDQMYIYRQTERSASLMTAYPLDRARRIEFQGGASQVSFDQILQTTTYSLGTGQLLDNTTQTTSLARSLTLGTSSAAYVFDTSNFGATSPVNGTRYRVEAAPTFGSINFTTLLADYRRYFMPAPFYTIAVRGMHFGRYGSGGDDPRLFPLYLGYPDMVRGYDVYTFDATDCPPTATGSCAAFDRLLGSRMMVGNIEFRFPLLRPFGVRQRMYGPVPVEVAFFADAGVAWNSLAQPATTIGPFGTTVQPHPFKMRNGVSSAGVAFRVNLFGFAVGEFDLAHPFQRPNQGWIFEFNLLPGW